MNFNNLVVHITIGTIASLLIPGSSNGDVAGITFALAADPVAPTNHLRMRQLKSSKASKASKSPKSSKSSKSKKKTSKKSSKNSSNEIVEITYPPVCTGEDVIVPDGLAEFPDSIMQGSYQLTSPFENALEVTNTGGLLPNVAFPGVQGGLDIIFQLRGICSLPSDDDTYNYFETVADSSLLDLRNPAARGGCRVLRTTKIDSAEPITWFEYQNVVVEGVESSIVEQADGQLLLKFSNCPDFPLGDAIAFIEATEIEEIVISSYEEGAFAIISN